MSDIMLQKTIALGINVETWKRYASLQLRSRQHWKLWTSLPELRKTCRVFSSQQVPPELRLQTKNYWFRRYSQCSHETNYNKDNAKASNPLALDFANGAIWSDPVWWDKAE